MELKTWVGINKKTNPFGFGCWQIAGAHSQNGKPNGWGEVNENEALALLMQAMESGINFFDTAQNYNHGKSEQLLGKAIKLSKKEVVVCTKIPISEKELKENKIGKDFLQKVNQSLQNLDTSYIDIVLIHNPPDDLSWRNFDYTLLDQLVEQGKIGTYGVSSRSIHGAQQAVKHHVGTTLEWVFHLLERRPINTLFPMIRDKKMNFIARSPLSRGLLTSKYIYDNPKFGPDDFRSTLPQDWIDWTLQYLRQYQSKGIETKNLLQNMLHFCAHYNEVNALIVGIKTKKQLQEYVSIHKTPAFNVDDLSELPAFYPKWA